VVAVYYEEEIYEKEYLDELLEDDEITGKEEGFMRGYEATKL
jgi:hypothetical protein